MKFYGLVFIVALTCKVTAGEIALTFDDAPTGNSPLMSGEKRTELLINELGKLSVNNAVFYVKTSNVDKESKKRLEKYTDAGFHLANHSHQHLSANKIPVNDYIKDVSKARLILNEFDNTLPLHRFPFLHYGKNKKSIENLQVMLGELGYRNGYVTVDNFDWYMNAMLVKARKDNKKIDYKKFGQLYVDLIWQGIEFYDDLAVKTLGRSPKHVLLLHENDAAAMFVGDLVKHIRKKWWKIISSQEAYKDPLATEFPKTNFHKQGRIAAVAHSMGVPVKKLRHPTENTEHLDALFEKGGVFE